MKKYFNFRLYKESLRQQQLIGWMSFIILALEAAIVPLGYVMNGYSYYKQHHVTETPLQMHPLMLGLFIVAPLLVLYQLNFLNQRKACDFYHAIPDRRPTVFVSMMAAVLTWCAFLIISGYVMAIITRMVFGFSIKFVIPYGQMFRFMCTLFSGCLFMAGLAALAVTLTGTPSTNVMVMALIGIAPRAITSIVYSMMYNTLPFIEYNASNIITNWGYNIPIGCMAIVFTGSATQNVWEGWGAIAYTTLVAVFFLALAVWLFTRRKSECAGRSAVSPVMQTVFRLVVPVGITVSVTTAIVMETLAGYGVDSDTMFIYLTFYVVAVVAYLLYELITSRQWKMVWRSMPGLLILLGINVAAALGVSGWYAYQTGFLPEEDDIVQVEYVDSMYASAFVGDRIKGTKLKDKIFCGEIAKEITRQTEAWNRDSTDYYQYDDKGAGYEEKCTFRVKDSHGRIWVRKVWLNQEQIDRMMECMKQNKEVRKKLTDLSGAKCISFYANWSDMNIDEENGGQILFQVFQKEVQEMDFSDWYSLLMGYYEADNSCIYVHLNYTSNSSNFRSFHQELPAELFPQTYKLYAAMVMNNVDQGQDELLRALNDPNAELTYANLCAYYEGHEEYMDYVSEKHDMEAVRQHLITCLTPAKGADMAPEKCIVRIAVEMFRPDEKDEAIAGAKMVEPDKDVGIRQSAVFVLTVEQYKQLFSGSFIKTYEGILD